MIQTHSDSFKAQFLLATSKPNSYWQHQNPILISNNQSLILIDNIKTQFSLATSKPNFHKLYFIEKEKSPRLSKLGKEKKNIMLPKQERPIASIYEETQKKNMFTNKTP